MAKNCSGASTLSCKNFPKEINLFYVFIFMDLYSYSQLAWLPFYDIKFVIFFIIVSVVFSILFIFVLKNLLNNKEQRLVDSFFDTLDNLSLDDKQKRIIKIFTVVKMKCSKQSYFLWYAVENTLSSEDKEYLESFRENEKFLPYLSDKYKEFLKYHDEEYQIFRKISGKFAWKMMKDDFIVIWIVLLFLMVLISAFSICYYFYFMN